MKKKLSLLIPVFLVLSLVFIACSNGTSPGGDDYFPEDNPGGSAGFAISGKFTREGNDVRFKLVEASEYNKSGKSAVRAAVDQSEELAGELIDADLTFRLKGSLDAGSGVYNVSAAGSFIRYSISGTVDTSTGASLSAIATLLVKAGPEEDDEWQAFTYPVVTEGVNVSFTEPEVADNSGDEGLPEGFLGSWNIDFDDLQDIIEAGLEISGTCLFSPFKYKVEFIMDGPMGPTRMASEANIISIDKKGNYYDVISAYPLYIGTKSQVAKAVDTFLKSKGITAIQFEDEEEWWEWFEDWIYGDPDDELGYAFYLEQLDDDSWEISWWGFYDDDISLVFEYYLSDYETLYLISQGVKPITKYCKTKIEQRNSTTLELTDYGVLIPGGLSFDAWFQTDFDKLEDAKALTELDDEPVLLTR